MRPPLWEARRRHLARGDWNREFFSREEADVGKQRKRGCSMLINNKLMYFMMSFLPLSSTKLQFLKLKGQ